MTTFVLSVLIACDGGPSEAPTHDAPAAAPEAPAAPAPAPAAASVSCEDFAKKLVSLLSVQGDDAFFKADDIPGMTEACEKADNLNLNKVDVDCVMKATDIETADACDLKAIMKSW